MIKYVKYCDRCRKEIKDNRDDNGVVIIALNAMADAIDKLIGKSKPDYYVGIKEGPELDLCDKCLDELRDFMKAGREEKADK